MKVVEKKPNKSVMNPVPANEILFEWSTIDEGIPINEQLMAEETVEVEEEEPSANQLEKKKNSQ